MKQRFSSCYHSIPFIWHSSLKGRFIWVPDLIYLRAKYKPLVFCELKWSLCLSKYPWFSVECEHSCKSTTRFICICCYGWIFSYMVCRLYSAKSWSGYLSVTQWSLLPIFVHMIRSVTLIGWDSSPHSIRRKRTMLLLVYFCVFYILEMLDWDFLSARSNKSWLFIDYLFNVYFSEWC